MGIAIRPYQPNFTPIKPRQVFTDIYRYALMQVPVFTFFCLITINIS
jgi:hypothetical protein